MRISTEQIKAYCKDRIEELSKRHAVDFSESLEICDKIEIYTDVLDFIEDYEKRLQK